MNDFLIFLLSGMLGWGLSFLLERHLANKHLNKLRQQSLTRSEELEALKREVEELQRVREDNARHKKFLAEYKPKEPIVLPPRVVTPPVQLTDKEAQERDLAIARRYNYERRWAAPTTPRPLGAAAKPTSPVQVGYRVPESTPDTSLTDALVTAAVVSSIFDSDSSSSGTPDTSSSWDANSSTPDNPSSWDTNSSDNSGSGFGGGGSSGEW